MPPAQRSWRVALCRHLVVGNKAAGDPRRRQGFASNNSGAWLLASHMEKLCLPAWCWTLILVLCLYAHVSISDPHSLCMEGCPWLVPWWWDTLLQGTRRWLGAAPTGTFYRLTDECEATIWIPDLRNGREWPLLLHFSLPDDMLNKDGVHCLVSMSSNPCTNGCMRLEVGLHMGREIIWHTSEVHTITAI